MTFNNKMHRTKMALALATLGLVAHAQVDLDMDDIPKTCMSICSPVGTLVKMCDVDLSSDNDRDEHLLENQCVCTNQTFKVGNIAALCAACVHQSRNEKRDHARGDGDELAGDDGLKDIDKLLSICGFSSTTFNSAAATSALSGVTVGAVRPTNIGQLTTTIEPGYVASTASATNTSALVAHSSLMTPMVGTESRDGSGSGSGSISIETSSAFDDGSSGGSLTSSKAESTSTHNAAPASTAERAFVGGIALAAYMLA